MTTAIDIPADAILIEAARRLGRQDNPSIEYLREVWQKPVMFVGGRAFRILCDTLVELGWQPPADPLLVEAREIAAKVCDENLWTLAAEDIRAGKTSSATAMIQAALAGIRRGMEMGRD